MMQLRTDTQTQAEGGDDMKLKPIGSNKTELETENMTVFFSYSTPVACLDRDTGEYYRTREKHSATTTKHINSWLAGVVATPLPQTFFDSIKARPRTRCQLMAQRRDDGPQRYVNAK